MFLINNQVEFLGYVDPIMVNMIIQIINSKVLGQQSHELQF